MSPEINIIYGPPGTGKTTYLLNLLNELFDKGYTPDQIAYVSYTKKGTYEGRDRAVARFDVKEKDLPYFRTLHSIAFKAANVRRANMIGKYYYKVFSQKMGMRFTGYYTEEFRNDDDKYLFFDILYRNNHKAANRFLKGLNIHKLNFVRKNYKRFRDHFNLKDFTDLIEIFIDKGQPLPVKIAVIDEAQDLTSLQWQMIWTAFADCEKIYTGNKSLSDHFARVSGLHPVYDFIYFTQNFVGEFKFVLVKDPVGPGGNLKSVNSINSVFQK